MGVGAGLMIASMAVAAVSSFAQVQAASTQAKAAGAAAVQNATSQYTELTRQEQDNDRVAGEQKSDRIRQADQELATLQVMNGESGGSGSTFDRQVSALSYTEGLDLSRIESNRSSQEAALEAGKKAAQQGATNVITQAGNQASAAKTSAAISFVGTGLQVAGSSYRYNQYLDTIKNKTPSYDFSKTNNSTIAWNQ